MKKKAPSLSFLDKFHLCYKAVFLILCCFIFQPGYFFAREAAKEDPINIVVEPLAISVGDTVSIKIKDIKDEKHPPKLFFNKTKIPVFMISDSWYRSLLPISADFSIGKYTIDLFYADKTKTVLLDIQETKYPVESLTLPKTVAALMASKTEQNLIGNALKTVSDKKLWDGKFIFPSDARKSTVYGVKRRINGNLDPGYFHKGLDFAANTGALIKAPQNGKVILVGFNSKGFVVNGNCIFLDHGHGVVSAYLHLSSILVKEGDIIRKGQIIGRAGSTGIASGPHLHWGVYVLGKTVEPLMWINKAIE